MAEVRLTRPTKPMMEAVNASIAGDQQAVDELVKQHKLDHKLLDRYVAKRAGKHYSLTWRKRGKKKATKKRVQKAPVRAEARDVLTMIDRRTKVATLLRLQVKVEYLIAQKDTDEVASMKKTLRDLEKFREQADAAAKKVKEAEALIGI